MMDGYSITEAASVLGVPTERVWELLARGVLAGAPEGETGMRVFLQPRAAPAPVTASFTDDPGAPTSNGPERELSPFRELLTEFRNLTERYGQALLALGESRGEVASLRSRVDLLEARIDLRLPMGTPAAPWPTQPQPVTLPPGEQEDEEAHRRRRRGARKATESFAEALARAEDPSPADLPGGTDAGAALASEAAAEDADRSLPRDVLPAEPVLVAEEGAAEEEGLEPVIAGEVEPVTPEPITDETEPAADETEPAVYETEPGVYDFEPGVDDFEPVEPDVAAVPDQVEPVAFEPAEADVEDLQLADAGASAIGADVADDPPAPEPVAHDATAEASPAPRERERWAEAESGDGLESDRASVEVEAPPELPEVEPPRAPAFGLEPEQEPIAAEAEAEERPIAAADSSEVDVEPEAVDFDAERYTSVIDQPDWFEAEADDEWPTATSSSEAAGEAEDSGVPGEPPPPEPEAPEPEPREGGADEMEVAAGGQVASSPPEGPPDAAPEAELPGSSELDEALEAYGDLGIRQVAAPSVDEEWPPATSDRPRMSSSAQRPSGQVTRLSYGSQMPSSSATRAYRRLRRIFPT